MTQYVQNVPFCVTLLSFSPADTPCLSPACQWASARLSMSADPFTRPCDYFLFTCGSDRLPSNSRGRQRGQDIHGHPQNQKEKVVWPQGRAQRRKRDRSPREEKILDRKTLLLLYLREILGRSLQPKCSNVHHSAFHCFIQLYLSELCFS